jgi:uncharacterized protein (TIGR02118 family)
MTAAGNAGIRGPDFVPHARVLLLDTPFLIATQLEEEFPMAAHLLVLYPKPKDAQQFDRAYRTEHLPLAGPKLQGAINVTTRRVVGPAFAPPPYHLISDVSFPDIEALKACAMSAGGKEALAHAESISTGGAPMVIALVDD